MACLFLFSFCSPQEKVDRIYEEGVEVVLNHQEPYKIGGISSFSLEETFKIDTENEKTENLGLFDIKSFIVNTKGKIFILRNVKGKGDFIFKFDESGEFVKSFAPPGQGPGELQVPQFIAVDSENNILITDAARRKLIAYDPYGVFINDYEMTRGYNRVDSGPRSHMLGIYSHMDSEKGISVYSSSLKLLNPRLEVIQEIEKMKFKMKPGKIRLIEPLFCWSASRDNIYMANEERGYEIRVYDLNGKLISKIKKEYTKIPVSQQYKKKKLKSFPEHLRARLYFPEFFPPFQSFIAGSKGKLLVATFEKGNEPGEFMFDIFNEDGVSIGRKSLNIWIWEGHVYAQMKDNKLYALKEKPNGYKELALYEMKWK